MKIGIDLGTTNSAVAYIDPREAEDSAFPPIHILPIPQYVAPETVEERRTLPSFLFLGDREYVGVYARDQGALVPTRLVHSAKSWLSNPEVDRTAKILPWDSQETGRVLSPVEVSARILAHMRDAWERKMGTPFAEQDVVLTVPASFDEEARELTVQAARAGGPARAHAARRARRGVLFLDRERSGANRARTCSTARWCWCATSAAARVRFHADPRGARGGSRRVHAHGGGPAPAAGRRQPGSDAGVAGGERSSARRSRSGSAARCGGSARRRKSGCLRIRTCRASR